MTEYFDVGNIVNTHGIKGEVRVQSITNRPEDRYSKGSPLVWFSKDGKEQLPLEVETHRVHKNFDLLKFKDYPSINEVENLVGGNLKVSGEHLSEDLDENEFYYYEIIGLQVVDEKGNEIGQVKEILSPGANDVWVVSRQGKEDLLLPNIEPVILNIDLDNEKITVHIMEGLDE